MCNSIRKKVKSFWKIVKISFKLPYGSDIRRVAKEFCQTTSIHGFYFIFHGIARIPWSLLTIGTISICLWQCDLNLQTYLTYDVKTTFTSNFVNETDFPSITFCSRNYLKRSGWSYVPAAPYILAAALAENIKNDTMYKDLAEKVQ